MTPPALDATLLSGEQEPLPAPSDDAGRFVRAAPNGLQYTGAGPSLRAHRHSTVFEPTETRRASTRLRACAPGEVPELHLATSGEYVRTDLLSRCLTVMLPRAVTYGGPG